MKSISADLLKLIATTHGYADLEWTRSIPIPGDPDFPVFQLPENKLAYSQERGYPISFEPRKSPNGSPLLFVQIESFDLEQHRTGNPAWAVPSKYKPETDEEAIAHELGFDEGWEDAQMECIFICDERFSVFWRAAAERERFGLTAIDTESLYPVSLEKRELAPLEKILKKWKTR
ncbi:MAG: hypothetical protein ABI867_23010 [Kofleriaceae bacterium]